MIVRTIGRSSSNDITIQDVFVGRNHCQIIQEDDGTFTLIDLGSTNGTYINGVRRHGQVKLNKNDIVRIGNTTLPWQSYFRLHTDPPTPPIPTKNSVLGKVFGIIALVLSIIGACLLIYVFILVVRFGVFAIFVGASYYMWVSVGINILAYILAVIADYNDYVYSEELPTTSVADIAQWLSGAGLSVVGALYLIGLFMR